MFMQKKWRRCVSSSRKPQEILESFFFINTSPSQIFKSSLNCRITGGWGGAERGLRFLLSGHPSKTSISVPLLHSTPLYVCIGRDSKLIASGHNLEHQTCPQSNSTLGRQGSQTWGARKKSPKDQFCPAPSLLDTWSGAFGLNYPDSEKHSCQYSQTLPEDSISCLISSIQPVPPRRQLLSRLQVCLVQVCGLGVHQW